MDIFLGVVVGLLILVFLVVIHELGHAIVALRNGVVVEEFGIGFPPRAWKKKLKNGVLLTLNWLPLGGFVKLQGENDSANKKGDYGSASFWVKTKILFAGVLVNWLAAVLLLTGLSLTTGIPKVLPQQFSVASDTVTTSSPVKIAILMPDYPAEKAGLKEGDLILRFAGEEVKSVEGLIDLTHEHQGDKVPVVYQRDGAKDTKQVSILDREKGTVFGAGLVLSQPESLKSTWSAPIAGVVTTGQFTLATFQGIGELLWNLGSGFVMQFSPNEEVRKNAHSSLQQAGSSVAGPVGILGVIFPSAQQAGLSELIFLTAIISLTLAVMNILPIPALDGGRWFLMALFRVRRKELTKEKEEKIVGTSFLVLLILLLIVTVSDVQKLF